MFDTCMEYEGCETASMCAFEDHEVICPFCECNYLSISARPGVVEYCCANCGGEWDVLNK